jgi:hypothetical protein
MAHERDVVLKNILQMTEAQFRQYWIGKVFRAESASAPKTVYTNEMAAGLINAIPGSIAFIEVHAGSEGFEDPANRRTATGREGLSPELAS